MGRYWVIAPYDYRYPDEWERVWNYDLKHGVISIGWSRLGDVSSHGEDELRKLYRRKYPKEISSVVTKATRMMHRFYHSVKPGHMVIARRGLKKLAAVGTVKRSAYHDPNSHSEPFGPEDSFANHLDIKWAKAPRDIAFRTQVFLMPTIYEITQEKFRSLMNGEESSLTEDLISIAKRNIDATTKETLVNARIGQGRFRTSGTRHLGKSVRCHGIAYARCHQSLAYQTVERSHR